MPRECELHTRSRNEMESGATPEVVVHQDHPTAQQVDADADARDATAYLAKITMATIETNPAAARASQKQTRLAVILGKAFETEEVKKPYKPNVVFLALNGNFEAKNIQDGNPSQARSIGAGHYIFRNPFTRCLSRKFGLAAKSRRKSELSLRI
jgi:hypothetical protein